MTEFLVN